MNEQLKQLTDIKLESTGWELSAWYLEQERDEVNERLDAFRTLHNRQMTEVWRIARSMQKQRNEARKWAKYMKKERDGLQRQNENMMEGFAFLQGDG